MGTSLTKFHWIHDMHGMWTKTFDTLLASVCRVFSWSAALFLVCCIPFLYVCVESCLSCIYLLNASLYDPMCCCPDLGSVLLLVSSGHLWRQSLMRVEVPLGFRKPPTHTRKNTHLWTQVRVVMGTGVGYSGKPQGNIP